MKWLTAGGFFLSSNILQSPKVSDAIVGLGPKASSLSECQGIKSCPSLYKLANTELKCIPVFSSKRSRSCSNNIGHWNRKQVKEKYSENNRGKYGNHVYEVIQTLNIFTLNVIMMMCVFVKFLTVRSEWLLEVFIIGVSMV